MNRMSNSDTVVDRKKLSLGYIGVGWIGKNRMEVISNSGFGETCIICEPSVANANKALEVASKAEILATPEELNVRPELDGVVIASPSALHAEQSVAALRAGKAVFCQKPLGRNAGEVKEVIEASRLSNKFLGVDLSYRYTKAFQKVYEIIKKGELGEIYVVDLVFHNAYGPDKEWFYQIEKSGGGCLMDLGIHLIDMAMWALDFPQTEVESSSLYHKGKRLAPAPVIAEDFAQATLRAGNILINIQCSWHLSAGKDAEIAARFYGTEAAAVFRNIDGSFYDFVAEKYTGTQSETLVSPPDNWSGKAGVEWARKVLNGSGFDPESAQEFLQTAQIIDKIYGR